MLCHSPTAVAGATAALLIIAAPAFHAARQARTLPPTPLEAFVSEPGTRTTWSKFIQRLDGGSASAIISAIEVSSASPPPRVMRGVRIELRHEGPRPDCDMKHVEWAVMCARENAAIYLAEDRLEAVRSQVLRESVSIFPGHPVGITRFGGTMGSGTIVGGYLLYNVTPEHLAAALGAASSELERLPR